MQEALETYYIEANRLSDYVLSRLALALDLNEDFFVDKVNHSVDVYPAEGAFLFNLGDLLAEWTNDRYRSTLHRVVPLKPQGEKAERLSVPFFREGNFDNWIECLPTCCSDDNPPKYPPVNAGKHLMAKYLGGRTMETYEGSVSTLGDRADAVLDE